MPIRVETDSPEDFLKLFALMGQRLTGLEMPRQQVNIEQQPDSQQPTYQPQITPQPQRMMLPQATTIQQEAATLIQPDIQVEQSSAYLPVAQPNSEIAELREQFSVLQQQLEAIAFLQQQAVLQHSQTHLQITDTAPAAIVKAEPSGQLTAKTAIAHTGNLIGKALDNTWVCLAILLLLLGLVFGTRSLPNYAHKISPTKPSTTKQAEKPKNSVPSAPSSPLPAVR